MSLSKSPGFIEGKRPLVNALVAPAEIEAARQLQQLVDAWATLSPAIRRAVVALIDAGA
jgi:hypothetical protein